MDLPSVPAAVDSATELVRLLRKLTPTQRRVLKALPENGGRFWSTLGKLGHSSHTGHKWMRQPGFARARELLEQRALDEIGVTHAYVLGTTKEVVDRCMREIPVRDKEGNATGDFTFKEQGALKGLEMLGKYRRLWADDPAKVQEREGPGLTVIVQTGSGQVGVQAPRDAQGRVVVQLPEPEAEE